jgi:hypothetical protein
MGGRTQYLNLPEVEMADRMCGGHRQVSQMVRNIYDRQELEEQGFVYTRIGEK